MEPLKLHWLGLTLVELKGRAVKLETRKAAALLSYLSMNLGKCQRERLATMFWPEASQQKALANLRRTLSSLNSRLPGWIEADRETIALKRNRRLWVDVEAFHQSLAQLKEHPHPENEVCEECLEVLARMAETYRGDFLESLNLSDSPIFDEWQFFQRDSLRQEFAEVLQRLSAGHAKRLQWEQAILCARRWVVLDHLHEPAHRALMDLYGRSGQRNAALHQYEKLAHLLHEQLGQEPEREMRRLYEQIRGSEDPKKIVESPERSSSLPLLKTKLYLPAVPASRVMRTQLINYLGDVKKKALTIFSAPGGFGKTTPFSEWVVDCERPAVWLSLDEGDNDPRVFYLTSSRHRRGLPYILEKEHRSHLNPLRPPSTESILPSLLNEVAFISDDNHMLDSKQIDDALAFLNARILRSPRQVRGRYRAGLMRAMLSYAFA